MEQQNSNPGNIEFHTFKECSSAVTKEIAVTTGFVKIATREQTMIDLVHFYRFSGHISNVALVVGALAEESTVKNFTHVIKQEKTTALLQRLGYLLAYTSLPHLAKAIEKELAQRTIRYVPLVPDFHQQTGEKDSRWKLVINDYLELG